MSLVQNHTSFFPSFSVSSLSLRKVIGICALTYGVSQGVSWLMSLKRKRIAQKIHNDSLEFRKNHKAKIMSTKIGSTNLPKEKIEEILNASVVQLKEMLKNSEVTCEDLVNIFTERAITIGIDLELLTDVNYQEAITLAKQYDQMIKENPSVVDKKPLFGIPISIKDCIDQKGFPSSIGVYNRVHAIKDKEGLIMHLVRESGAIPFIRTNVPQFAFSYESQNKLYGKVKNPWDVKKMSGGSSGGEAAAIAARVSPIGLGTDIAGSIRTPSGMTGIYGFKPTSGRIPIQGGTYYSPILAGKTIIRTTSGPMGKSVEDLVLLMKAVTNVDYIQNLPPSLQDIYEVIKPFDEKSYSDRSTKLRIGYYKTLSYFDSTLCNQRAVEEAAEALRKAGHEVVEIEFPFAKELTKHFYIHSSCDQIEGYQEIIGDEDFGEEFTNVVNCSKWSKAKRAGICKLLRFLGENRVADTVEWGYKLSAPEYLRNCDSILKYRQKVISFFQEHKIQAIISPCFSHPAVAHDMFRESTINSIYNLIWNVVNFPSGVVPVTQVRKDEQHYTNSRIKDKFSKLLDQRMRQNTEGMPVGVQITCLPHRDELCLNVMKQLDDQIQFYQNHSFPM
ncbi:hypothetical protein ABPG74_019783 [Tetrahymena malaccensis]